METPLGERTVIASTNEQTHEHIRTKEYFFRLFFLLSCDLTYVTVQYFVLYVY